MRKKSRINQKGGILSWIIFFIVIMMIFGVLLFLQSHSQKNIPSEKQTTSESEKKDGKKFATPELTEEEKRERDNVRLNEALRQGTPEACETIEFDSELKQNCIENTWFALAIKEENENTCAILKNTTQHETCFNQVYYNRAISEIDMGICQKIMEPALRQNCTDRIGAMFTYTPKNKTRCESIQDSILKKGCLDNTSFSSGIETLNSKFCDEITNSALKENCNQTVTQNIKVTEFDKEQMPQVGKSSPELLNDCESLEGEEKKNCRDEVNFDLTLEKKDLNYCGTIQNDQKRSECLQVQGENLNRFYLKQAIAKKDIASCEKITTLSLKNSCINHLQ
ncbi:hypothetical protein COY07_02320 [Candidatus Peregrinibacteria bacterium CG_4_10_14_0_2_um_filter_43_11]|nr:MAG: hypothetical protein COY07_02320 [Candidatus Peregrinibacteria bacterium CG_4_10_14_0_2_um_filter_43_11]